MEVTQEMIACWRVNYGLDKSIRNLELEYQGQNVPLGCVLALKVAVAEIERLQAALKRHHADLADELNEIRCPSCDEKGAVFACERCGETWA